MRSEGLAAASEAEFTVVCLGLDRSIEGEQIEGLEDDCLDSGDKKNVYLPKVENSFTFALLGSKTEFISAILAIIAGIAIIIFIAKRKK